MVIGWIAERAIEEYLICDSSLCGNKHLISHVHTYDGPHPPTFPSDRPHPPTLPSAGPHPTALPSAGPHPPVLN